MSEDVGLPYVHPITQKIILQLTRRILIVYDIIVQSTR